MTTLRVIRDNREIGQLTAFARTHDTQWKTNGAGVPVALVGANFYAGNKFLGDLDVGNNFLTAQGCGDFQSRDVSPQDREEVLGLLGVKDPYEGNH
ncbi:hypothetical protein [Rhodanobacter sp. L36]|uniref:hypothetical protein n=1 Tax=Rhodanobacter sp. L36 TaxID=1747221 RepID=UPI00131D27FA|nr:hypothetical protein [Rhodanobacter sp. L36]